MNWKDIIDEFNIVSRCKNYGVPLWQCPNFLFLVMGGVIILSALVSYVLGKRYINEPEITVLIILILTSILLVIALSSPDHLNDWLRLHDLRPSL